MEQWRLWIMMLLYCLMQTGMASVSTYNATFSNYYDISKTALFSVKDYYSTWDLGTLNVGDVITFELTLPNSNTSGPNLNFNYLPSCLQIYYLNETNPNNSVPVSAKYANGSIFYFPLFSNLTATYTFYSANYTVALPEYS